MTFKYINMSLGFCQIFTLSALHVRIDKFLKTHKLLKLTQEEIENLPTAFPERKFQIQETLIINIFN